MACPEPGPSSRIPYPDLAPTLTPYGWVDLDAPFQILPRVPFNAEGVAEITQTIPPAAGGVTVYLQAAELASQPRLSNSFAE